jgi:hypothetical protein
MTNLLGEDVGGTTNGGNVWECFAPHHPNPKVVLWVQKGITGLEVTPLTHLIDSPNAILLSFKYGNLNFCILNIYNTIHGGRGNALTKTYDAITDTSIPTAIAGDFNLHHCRWKLNSQPAPAHNNAADKLVDWCDTLDLTIKADTSTPTRFGHSNQQDSIIDLLIYSGSLQGNNIFTDFCNLGQDARLFLYHATLEWTVEPKGPVSHDDLIDPIGKHVIDPKHKDKWCQKFQDIWRQFRPPKQFTSADEVEQVASKMVKMFTLTTRVTMLSQACAMH